MGGVGDRFVGEASQEILADKCVLLGVCGSQCRRNESKNSEQHSCRTHGEKKIKIRGKGTCVSGRVKSTGSEESRSVHSSLYTELEHT